MYFSDSTIDRFYANGCRFGVAIIRHWIPIVLFLAAMVLSAPVRADFPGCSNAVDPPIHAGENTTQIFLPLIAANPQTASHGPAVRIGSAFVTDRWGGSSSAETDPPDLDPVMTKTHHLSSPLIPDTGLLLRPLSAIQLAFTPLYLAYQSFRC